MNTIVKVSRAKLEEMLDISKWDKSILAVKTDRNDNLININTVQTHKLAGKHRIQSEQEYISLVHSIMISGQLLPIILYRGKMVDGRHRLMVMKELGAEWIAFKELPNNWSLKQVEDAVFGTDNGRNDSPLQKAAKALINFKQDGAITGEMDEYAIKHGTTKGSLSKLNKFADWFGPERIKEAYETDTVWIGGKPYKSISSLYKLAIEAARASKKDDDIDASIKGKKDMTIEMNAIIGNMKSMSDEDFFYTVGIIKKIAADRINN